LNQHVDQKPQKKIALSGKAQYYTYALDRSTLAPGLYKMRMVRLESGWTPGFEPTAVSNDEPLEIDESVKNILKEIDDFFERRSAFKKIGFSHKRGYLLHGPPGCGKSCTLRLLEKRFVEQFQGIVLYWDNGNGIQMFYEHIRDQEKSRPVMVVCEDIDSYMEAFEENILEFLDGQVGLDNFVLVATTNNINKVPSRIKDRPSRIDQVIEMGKPNESVRFEYLRKLGVVESVSKDLAHRTDGLSIAQLKEIVVATVCLGHPLGPVLKRLEVADMSPLEVETEDDDFPYNEEDGN